MKSKAVKITMVAIVLLIVGGIVGSNLYDDYKLHQRGMRSVQLVLDTPFGILVGHNIMSPESSEVLQTMVEEFEPKNAEERAMKEEAMEKIRETLVETLKLLEEMKEDLESMEKGLQKSVPNPATIKGV